jgi:hypothetical protein
VVRHGLSLQRAAIFQVRAAGFGPIDIAEVQVAAKLGRNVPDAGPAQGHAESQAPVKSCS